MTEKFLVDVVGREDFLGEARCCVGGRDTLGGEFEGSLARMMFKENDGGKVLKEKRDASLKDTY